MPKAEAKYTLRAEDKTQAGLRSAAGRLQRFGVRAVAGVAAAVGVVGAGITAWSRQIDASAARLNRLGDEAAKLNATLEETAALQLGAEIIGTDVGELRDVAETLAERIREARGGSKDMAQAFADIGVDIEKLDRLGVLAQIVEVSEALQRVSPQQARALTSELFGEGRGGIFQRDLRSAFGAAGQSGLLRGLGPLVGQAQETRRSRAILDATFNRWLEEVFTGEVAANVQNVLTAGLRATSTTMRDDAFRGETTIGQRAVEAQLRAAKNLESAAEGLERVVGKYQ